MNQPQKTVAASIASALLVLCLLFLGVSLALGAFIYIRHATTNAEQASLRETILQAKSRERLQSEMMQGDNRHALYPHADKRVGFVFNRHIGWTSLYAAEGDKYPINDMGLRGKPIKPKAPGVKRIALVSDSWLFGWRLTDNDRPASQLSALLLHYYPNAQYEVITVAVPGWNVENEAAFVEDYFDQMQPDVLVWSINANDLWDTQAVVPPGVPAGRPSGGNRLCPDIPIQWSNTSAPIVLERWQKNIALMNAVSKSRDVPILALHVYEDEPYVSMIQKVGKPTFPIVSTPAQYHLDPRWVIDPTDSHPTAWATKILAADILAHLIEYGHLPPVELTEFGKEVADNGRAASVYNPDRVAGFINSTHGVPANIDRASRLNNGAITQNGEACPQGRVSLGRSSGSRLAEISFEDVRPSHNTLNCHARTNDGQAFEGVTRGATCLVTLPAKNKPDIVDLYWSFDRFTCTIADDCFSARFLSAGTR